MRRAALLILLLALAVVGLLLLESFLPFEWPHPISALLNRLFSGQPYAPHPRMDLEIEMVLRQQLAWRLGSYLVTAALATGNAFLMSRVWKACRSFKPSSPQT